MYARKKRKLLQASTCPRRYVSIRACHDACIHVHARHLVTPVRSLIGCQSRRFLPIREIRSRGGVVPVCRLDLRGDRLEIIVAHSAPRAGHGSGTANNARRLVAKRNTNKNGRFGLFAKSLRSTCSHRVQPSLHPPNSSLKHRNEFRIFFLDGTILSWSKVDARGSCYKLRYANLISARVELHRSLLRWSSLHRRGTDLIGTVSRATPDGLFLVRK